MSMGTFYEDSVNKRKVTIASYPRSGSNWICYCIERLTDLIIIGSDDSEERGANITQDPTLKLLYIRHMVMVLIFGVHFQVIMKGIF